MKNAKTCRQLNDDTYKCTFGMYVYAMLSKTPQYYIGDRGTRIRAGRTARVVYAANEKPSFPEERGMLARAGLLSNVLSFYLKDL